MGETILELQGVTKSFSVPTKHRHTVREHVLDLFRPHPHERLDVLRGVSFQLRRGEALGIMGRNGSGKSTLLKVVSGIFTADSGSVIVRAPVTPILELGVGWNPDLDAVDNIYLLGSVMGLSLAELRRSIPAILEFADLERFANLELRHYSSGMAARLAYSVAFRAVKDILILDEIFAVGDAGFKARCIERFQALAGAGHTIVVVSHDPSIIQNFCGRALLLEGGQIAMQDTADRVSEQYLAMLTESRPTAVLG